MAKKIPNPEVYNKVRAMMGLPPKYEWTDEDLQRIESGKQQILEAQRKLKEQDTKTLEEKW